MSRHASVLALAAAAAALAPARGRAHHEAIFGPQSSLVLSAPGFVSVQTFSRQTGTPGDRTQETTALVSGAVTPFSFPLSFSVIVPASQVARLDRGGSRVASENLILGARYRYDLEGLNRATGKDGNFLMGMVAVEPPTGSMDHRAFHGPWNAMLAALASAERGPFSAIGYGFYRLNGSDAGAKKGDNLIAGAGLAFTPIDARQILSFQLGASFERYARDTLAGAPPAASGGDELLLHPTVVWGAGSVLVFAVVSLPAHRDFAQPLQQDRWRVGGGVTYVLGGR
jgi:hypothetical protein